jgi:signal transduction histidine kinase
MSTSGIEYELGDDWAASWLGDFGLAEHVRTFDWASTPLGALDSWLPSLRFAVSRAREDELRALVDDLRRAQRRAAEAGDAERRRIEQNLHDGAQQRLISLRLELGLLSEMIESKPAEAVERLAELRSEFDDALEELRELAHGLYPPVLASDGLLTALKAMTRHAAIPITLESVGLKRVTAPVESAAYFCCVEAVQNACKHGGDGVRVAIRLRMGDGVLRFVIADDGRGFDTRTTEPHQGLTNLRDRIEALGGRLKIGSIPGHGTTVSGEIPLP